MVQRIGTVDSATSHPDPCGGQAPALQDSGCRRNDEVRRGNLDSRPLWDASIFVPIAHAGCGRHTEV